MDIFLRTIAIFIEVVLLTAITYSVLSGARLIAFDLGIRPKYNKMVTVVLITGGVIVLVFFIAHLIALNIGVLPFRLSPIIPLIPGENFNVVFLWL